jgi:hypothetical protein
MASTFYRRAAKATRKHLTVRLAARRTRVVSQGRARAIRRDRFGLLLDPLRTPRHCAPADPTAAIVRQAKFCFCTTNARAVSCSGGTEKDRATMPFEAWARLFMAQQHDINGKRKGRSGCLPLTDVFAGSRSSQDKETIKSAERRRLQRGLRAVKICLRDVFSLTITMKVLCSVCNSI